MLVDYTVHDSITGYYYMNLLGVPLVNQCLGDSQCRKEKTAGRLNCFLHGHYRKATMIREEACDMIGDYRKQTDVLIITL